MNKSHIEGGLDQAVGKVKEAVGNATGNQKLANKGAAQQVKGAAKETWGNVKDSAHEVGETARTQAGKTAVKADESGRELRDKLTTAAENVKKNIAGKLDEFNKKQENKRDEVRKAG